MKKLMCALAATVLALALGACSTSAPSTSGSTGAVTTSEAGTGAAAAGSPTTGATGSAPADSGTAAASATPVDQSTPEAAMTAWLTALLAGDSSTVCGLMAVKGTAIEDLPDAKQQCAKAVTPMLGQLKSVKDLFKGLKVQGAKVQGDTATFDAAKTTPDMAASIIKNLKAVRLKGKWYITQG
jgi:hypothetical protein